MTNSSLAENFNQYFEIVFAASSDLKREGYQIRHQVYAEELGWEPISGDGLEMDEYDNYAYSLLLKHKRTGAYAGTVRLIIPPPDAPGNKLPFENHFVDSLLPDIKSPCDYDRGAFGEVSRLAVPEDFRRRAGEKKQPFIVNELSGDGAFSEEERRNFPNIAIGLYLSIISFAKMCNHETMFVVVEPRLKKRLERVGLFFEQIGEEQDYHGIRALFCLPRENFESKFNVEMLELYQSLEEQLVKQIKLHPYLVQGES
ncbi:PEP-CTERM/exosortase system-associated acyltransferase [Neptunicella sp. SCSIO 80796]|uniref:PEP-CTERM/exosortase system-associated acyltransferase n=1 Tax=Neptunicella plasticusilytica TaxID=3117012 RepID=UPI003A4DE667